jgi:hypothetical protein
MRFQKGIGYPHPEQRPTRGPGDPGKPGGAYRMSRAAYEQRQMALLL